MVRGRPGRAGRAGDAGPQGPQRDPGDRRLAAQPLVTLSILSAGSCDFAPQRHLSFLLPGFAPRSPSRGRGGPQGAARPVGRRGGAPRCCCPGSSRSSATSTTSLPTCAPPASTWRDRFGPDDVLLTTAGAPTGGAGPPLRRVRDAGGPEARRSRVAPPGRCRRLHAGQPPPRAASAPGRRLAARAPARRRRRVGGRADAGPERTWSSSTAVRGRPVGRSHPRRGGRAARRRRAAYRAVRGQRAKVGDFGRRARRLPAGRGAGAAPGSAP